MAKTKASKNTVNEKWFKDQLRKADGGKGISQRKAAKILGINQATITQMFKGRRKMPLAEAPLWAELFNCSVDDVTANVGVETPDSAPSMRAAVGKIEVEGWADGNLVIHRDDNGLRGSKYAPSPGLHNGAVKCIRCQTSGSKFEGMDGALIYYNYYEGFDPDALARMCIVKIKNKDTDMIRIVKRGYESGKHNLALPNGETSEENVIIESASPILWMKL